MTVIRGVFGARDEVGDPFHNTAEDIRAAMWHALGGAEGILEGFAMSTVAAAMEVDFAAGRALIAERGVDITAEDRGYYVFADDTTTVTFQAASVADRCDAVVFAWPDPQYGSLGGGVTEAGPQIVVIQGVSGSTTPRTDSEINTAVGVGGWFRYADVVIDSTDTEINAANITLTYPNQSSDWMTVGATGAPAFQNSWSAGALGQPPRFRKDAAGNVHLFGAMEGGGTGTVAFTLPAGFRPSAPFRHAAAGGTSVNRLTVEADGDVVPTWASSDDIYFSVVFSTV